MKRKLTSSLFIVSVFVFNATTRTNQIKAANLADAASMSETPESLIPKKYLMTVKND